MKTVLLTGASGRIGKTVFAGLRTEFRFVLTDVVSLPYPVDPPHRFETADLSNVAADSGLFDNVDTVIHLAGLPHPDSTFEELLPNNIVATYNVFEAACRAGCSRVIFASSAQTIEGYPVDRQIHAGMQVRPANLYGVSKCFGEALGAYYAARRGVSVIALRIGAFEFPDDHHLESTRDLSAFLSPRDAVQLVECAIKAKDIDFLIAHGISNNRFKRLDLAETFEKLGYAPRDDAFAMFDIPIDQIAGP